MQILESFNNVSAVILFGVLAGFALLAIWCCGRSTRRVVVITPSLPKPWVRRGRIAQFVVCILLCGAIAGLFIGVERSTTQRAAITVEDQKIAGAVVIDYSGSMDNHQQLISASVDRISVQSPKSPVGYVIFSDRPLAYTPVTTPDAFWEAYRLTHSFVFDVTRTSSIISGGTDIYAGIAVAEEMLERDSNKNAPLVLISDLADSKAQWRLYLSQLADQGRPIRIVAINAGKSDLAAMQELMHDDFEIFVVAQPSDADALTLVLGGDTGGVAVAPLSNTFGPERNTLLSAAFILTGLLAAIVFVPVRWGKKEEEG